MLYVICTNHWTWKIVKCSGYNTKNVLTEKSFFVSLLFTDFVLERLCSDLCIIFPQWDTDADQDPETFSLPLLLVPVSVCSNIQRRIIREEEYRGQDGWHFYAVPGGQCSGGPLMVGQYREWPQSRVRDLLLIFVCILVSRTVPGSQNPLFHV